MTAAEHMAQVLRGTGLYTLDGDTWVDAELSAYGAGFALIEAFFTELLRELFIETAAGYGLDCWELLFRPQVSAGTAGQRRASLLARLGVGGDAHTLAEYSALLPGAGVEGTLAETEEGGLLVTGSPAGVTEEEAERELDRLLPAHLAWELQQGETG